ncbi:hypothetical protein AT251_24005 [Enterovibrio nigricans]|nr:hypothetical protein AT251_24005 [Enterovibrio nigricans]
MQAAAAVANEIEALQVKDYMEVATEGAPHMVVLLPVNQILAAAAAAAVVFSVAHPQQCYLLGMVVVALLSFAIELVG